MISAAKYIWPMDIEVSRSRLMETRAGSPPSTLTMGRDAPRSSYPGKIANISSQRLSEILPHGAVLHRRFASGANTPLILYRCL